MTKRFSVVAVWRILFASWTVLGTAIPSGGTEAQQLDREWWVIVGSFPEPGASRSSVPEFSAVNEAAARCGLRAFNDFSSKFFGFRPGYEVYVIGPYREREDAEKIADVARKCLPGAYVKFGEYAGE